MICNIWSLSSSPVLLLTLCRGNPRGEISAFQLQIILYIFPSPMKKLSFLSCVFFLKENTLFAFVVFFLRFFYFISKTSTQITLQIYILT